jgi:RNA polymerase I-specific transcription initiation factor RRN6
LDAASFNEGYWVGIGGRILQIAFAEKGDLQTNHLAVRQVGATTIFRPVYRSDLVPAVAPRGYVHTYPASRLHANPIATLTAERSGLESHADVAFNPWYSRQFAVVDDFGSWSTWEFEGGYKKDSCARLIQGKRANIYDGFAPDSGLKKPNNADGWHKVLWAGNLSTIVVCNRRHLAVFDVKSAPTRIQTKNFFAARNSDWILDLKRSPSNLGHLFVLTSSRIFWLEIIPDGEGENGDIGFRIFLSYRHFRDPNDETLRLVILKGDEGKNYALNFTSFTN